MTRKIFTKSYDYDEDDDNGSKETII